MSGTGEGESSGGGPPRFPKARWLAVGVLVVALAAATIANSVKVADLEEQLAENTSVSRFGSSDLDRLARDVRELGDSVDAVERGLPELEQRLEANTEYDHEANRDFARFIDDLDAKVERLRRCVNDLANGFGLSC